MGNAQSPLASLGCQLDDDHDDPPRMDAVDFFKRVKRDGLVEVIASQGGLVQVLDVFPQEDAERALQTLQSLSHQQWHESKTTFSYDASHHFYRYDGDGDGIVDIKRQISVLAPDYFPNFHGAKYESGGLIQKHDDSHHFQVNPGDQNRSQRYPGGAEIYRKIAIIYYMTKDWSEDYGGCLVDLNHLDAPKEIVPQFNSFVTFLVPRDHEVSQMMSGSPARYTIFGWFSDYEPYDPVNRIHPAMLRVQREDTDTSCGSSDGSLSS